MNKKELVQWLACHADVQPAAAADQLDALVADILSRLRQGRPVELPGLGVLLRDPGQRIRFQPEPPENKSTQGGGRKGGA